MAPRQSAKHTSRSKKPVSKDLQEDQEQHHESPSPPPPSTEKSKLRKNQKKENEDEKKGKEIEEKDDRALAWRMNWKAEDETAILKGMASFKASTGHDPYKHAEAFTDFMKESEYSVPLSSIVKLKDKIRKMKRKFTQGLGVQEFKELAKKVWEPEPEEAEEQEQERRCNTKRKKLRIEGVKREDDDNDDNWKSIIGNWSEVLPGVSEKMLNKAFNSIEESEKEEWVTRWKKHQIAEFELCMNKTELIRDLARLLWGAYKSLNN